MSVSHLPRSSRVETPIPWNFLSAIFPKDWASFQILQYVGKQVMKKNIHRSCSVGNLRVGNTTRADVTSRAEISDTRRMGASREAKLYSAFPNSQELLALFDRPFR